MTITIGKGISGKLYFYFSLGFYYFSAGWFFCKKNYIPRYNELNESGLMSQTIMRMVYAG